MKEKTLCYAKAVAFSQKEIYHLALHFHCTQRFSIVSCNFCCFGSVKAVLSGLLDVFAVKLTIYSL